MSSRQDIAMSVDVLIVGAGFGGLQQLIRLRELSGLSVEVYEEAPDLGGLWYWNGYPGARTDSEWNIYQLSNKEIHQEWSPKESFPDRNAILDYFHLVEEKFKVKRDIRFGTRVESAHWDTSSSRWIVNSTSSSSETLLSTSAKYLILCTGLSSKAYIPDFNGIASFKGATYHTAKWPLGGVDFSDKRVGVIGTGSTGVQVIQTIHDKGLESLTVFQRTPNIALPMQLRQLDDSTVGRDQYPEILQNRLTTFTGFGYDLVFSDPAEATPAERERLYEEHWEKGGLRLWIAGYMKAFTDPAYANEVYEFWRKKQGPRVVDPVVREKLVPTVPPHHFGIRRPSLEQRYYEAFNHPNVHLVDIKETPIVEFTEAGIRMEDGKDHLLDIVVFATGFDAVTGGITQIDIRGKDGVVIREKWKDGVHTQLGLATAGFPNMFFLYGPQAPTAFANGPSCIEVQSQFVTSLISHMKDQTHEVVEASDAAEKEWTVATHDTVNRTLVADTGSVKSPYTGSNIPGKKVEPLNFLGGMPAYVEALGDCQNGGWKGWVFS
ncbi:hypothetical protein V5O48_010462 [Marasmius crinis-equi]|uniref:Cyclohexanone monooxygenase n=1 Tax=Marasmius crinis-equi TaxID=585013 RepID=A0ABR3F8K7_9AGAR